MATADTTSGDWAVVCRKCQTTVNQGSGPVPEQNSQRVLEAMDRHMVQCTSRDFVVLRRGRITED